MSSPLTTVSVSSATKRENSADEYKHLEALKTVLLHLTKVHLCSRHDCASYQGNTQDAMLLSQPNTTSSLVEV